ncbi:MAG: DUF4307 domain-containing protein [Candidatus Nanopelagicales bacterium]
MFDRATGGVMGSAIDGRTLPPDLQARYGVGRRPWPAIIAGVAAIAVFVVALAFVTANLLSPTVKYQVLAWRDVSADRVDITFEVRRAAEWDVYCVLRAQDESRADVAYTVVAIPRGTTYEQVTYSLRTLAPAYIVEVLACEAGSPPERVVPPQFPPGVVPPEQPWTP